MKKLAKLFGIIIVALIVCTMIACDHNSGGSGSETSPKTPVASDYEIGNLTQSEGSVTAVTIMPKAGKSSGARTIYYEGTGGTTYAKSTTLPTAQGTYTVTFDVAAVEGWNAATGLSAGILSIIVQTPNASDYDINGLWQTEDHVNAVSVKAKSGKSTGAITIHYEGTGGTTYAKSTTVPQASGTYAVTFDVAAVTGWYPATGLSAGNLVVNTNQTPVANDYDFSNQTQTAGKVTALTITAKSGKSPGGRTIYYEGTTYAKSTTIPQAEGTYTVTFNVAAATGWNPATGLSAGNLVVNTNQTPVASDYNISTNLTQTAGSVTHVTVTAKSGKSPGGVTVYYEGSGSTTYAKSTTLPTAVGTYAVTFDVATATGWNGATSLPAGTLTIAEAAP